MEYRRFGKTGLEVSALGFGCMRFPTVKDENGKDHIDEELAVSMVRRAIDKGVNYIDTAYPYHDGMSEIVVGRALQDGYREKVYLATKAPVWMYKSEEDFDRTLDEQLKKLDTEYIDFYLLHALNNERWEDTVLKYNLLDKAVKAKEEGKIRHIGFSFHDEMDVFMKILDGFDGWDFCQIQMNYIDVDHQATIKGLEEAGKRGLGLVIMEPLLGGKLANPTDNVRKMLGKEKEPAEWALDFLWNRPEVSLLLSGMSNMQQTEDNLVYASRSSVGMLTEKDLDMLAEAKKVYDTMALVSCTKCEYCMPCPAGINIPKTFEAYNQTASKGLEEAKKLYETLEIKADACRKCRKCEKVCPQSIKISENMVKIAEIFKAD